jgi:hypothetical protein
MNQMYAQIRRKNTRFWPALHILDKSPPSRGGTYNTALPFTEASEASKLCSLRGGLYNL